MNNFSAQGESNPLFLEGGPEDTSTSNEGRFSGWSSVHGSNEDFVQPRADTTSSGAGWSQQVSTSSYRRRHIGTPRFLGGPNGRQTIAGPPRTDVSIQASPVAEDKETQTEAYVIMDTSVSMEQFDENGNLLEEDVAQLLAEAHLGDDDITCPGSESTSSSSSPVPSEIIPSQNALPPINPCLNGDCTFADELGDENDPVWLGCEAKDPETGSTCNYWIHARCHGFPYMSQNLVQLAKGFRCPRHLE